MHTIKGPITLGKGHPIPPEIKDIIRIKESEKKPNKGRRSGGKGKKN